MWFLVVLILLGYVGGFIYMMKLARDAAWSIFQRFTKRAGEVTNARIDHPSGRRRAAGDPDTGADRIAQPDAYAYADSRSDPDAPAVTG